MIHIVFTVGVSYYITYLAFHDPANMKMFLQRVKSYGKDTRKVLQNIDWPCHCWLFWIFWVYEDWKLQSYYVLGTHEIIQKCVEDKKVKIIRKVLPNTGGRSRVNIFCRKYTQDCLLESSRSRQLRSHPPYRCSYILKIGLISGKSI